MRWLVVNADDLGLCPAVNEGIARAHDHGIVTSTSLMVRPPAARDAVRMTRNRPALSVGLHLDIAEWIHDGEGWRPLYEVVDPADAGALESEARRQLASFRELVGSDPTHLDSHQHVHRTEPFAAVAHRIAAELSVPLRERTPGVVYRGDFYGQSGKGLPYPGAITVDALRRLIETLGEGITELGCHPAADATVRPPYAEERVIELDVLCDPGIRRAIATADVQLVSFAAVAAALVSATEAPR